MTKTIVRLLAATAVVAAIQALPSPSFAAPPRQDPPLADVRVFSAATDLRGVDVYVNGELDYRNVRYGQESGYQTYAPGDLQIQVVPRGIIFERGPAVIDTKVPVKANMQYTLAVAGSGGKYTLQVYTDSWDAPGKEGARTRVIALSPGLSPVDVTLPEAAGAKIATGLAYTKASAYADIPAGETAVVVRPAGNPAGTFTQTVTFDPGTIYTLFLIGLPSGNPALALAESQDAVADMSKLRIVHGAPNSPAVDVYADGQSVLQSIEYSEISNYIDLLPGEYRMQVVPAGKALSAGPVLIDTKLKLESGDVNVLAVSGMPNALKAFVAVDKGRDPVAIGRGLIRVWHLSPDAPAIDAILPENNNVKIAEDLSFGEASPYRSLDGAAYPIAIVPTGKTTTVISTNAVVPDGGATTLYIFGLVKGSPGLSAAEGRDR